MLFKTYRKLFLRENVQNGKNEINNSKTELESVWTDFEWLGLISVLCCLSALGMWREQFFSPRNQCVSSLPWLSDIKGIAVLAKLEPTGAFTLLSRNQVTPGT